MGFSKDMKASGLFVVSTVECMGAFKPFAQKALAEGGIVDPVPGQWYDVAAFMKVFKEMSDRFGANTIFQIGKKTVELAPFPPEIDSIEAGLNALCMSYSTHHRGAEIGYIRFTKTGERSATMVCRNPYPCDWDRGTITTAAERLKKPGQFVKVVHDDTQPCRKKGADECTYHVSW